VNEGSQTTSLWAHESGVGKENNEQDKDYSLRSQKDCGHINVSEGTHPTLYEGVNVRFHELHMTNSFSLFTLLAWHSNMISWSMYPFPTHSSSVLSFLLHSSTSYAHYLTPWPSSLSLLQTHISPLQAPTIQTCHSLSLLCFPAKKLV